MKLQISQEPVNQINQKISQLIIRPGMVKGQNFIKINLNLRILYTLEFWVTFLKDKILAEK